LAPKTNDARVVHSRNDDCRGVINCVADFLTAPTVIIPLIPTSAVRILNNFAENAFGGGFVTAVTGATISVVVEMSSSSSLLPPPIRRLMPKTDQAVLKSVKKNPPIITENIFRISNELPKLPANGKVIRAGTKKTGNHFANNVAPGFKLLYIASPHSFLIAIIVANSDPHPASEDGNGMEYFVKRVRNCTSRNISIAVARIVFCLLLPELPLTGVVAAEEAESWVLEDDACLRELNMRFLELVWRCMLCRLAAGESDITSERKECI
jgi:hypothetical protein